MKTNNIFRMLLVAAALLMGANNAKAEEIQIWPTSSVTENFWLGDWGNNGVGDKLILNSDYFKNFGDGDHLKIVVSQGNLTGSGSPQIQVYTSNWTSVYSNSNVDVTSILINDVSKFITDGLLIQGYNLYIHSLIRVTGSGSSTTTGLVTGENVVWEGEFDCNSYSVGQLVSTDLFKLASAGNTVRIYGNFYDTTNWATEFMYDDNGWKIFSIPEWGSNSKAEPGENLLQSSSNGTYLEFTLTTENLAIITSVDNCVVHGVGFKALKVVIYVAPTSNITTPTLSFGQTTEFNIAYGQSFTPPTLTSSVDDLTISYSSNNLDVAKVNASTGAVEIKGVGQAIITATSAAVEGQYNSATASYTINVSKADASISFSGNVELTFGDTFTPPTVTTTPADATLTYTTSDANIVYIGEDGSIVPVGEGTATITGTFAGNNIYNGTSGSYTVKVNKPTRSGAVWTGAAWLGNYGIDGVGTHPEIPTNSISSANVGDIIRFYGKLGPLSDTDWRVEIHGNPWNNQLDDVNSGNTPDNAGFVKGYFDMPITTTNINMFTSTNNLTLNGYNLTITAVELITASTPAKQDVTLAFSASTATATIGQSFSAPTLTATNSNGETVTSLNIVYSSSKTSVATVNSSTGAVTIVGTGTTIITASFSGDNNYNAAQSVNYILTVSDPELTDNDWIQVTNIDYGYRTYVTPQAIDFSRSVGVEGYYATGLNEAGTEVIFTQVLGVCDARVPLLLKKTSTTECKLLKSTATATATTPENNMLVAGGRIVEGDNFYVLTYHSGRVVFAETNINSASVDSEHAYLNLNSRNARAQVSIRFVKGDDATGINDVEAETAGTKVIYDLRGQRVEHPTKGLYIVNGKKVLYK